jgi:hypothetical protein
MCAGAIYWSGIGRVVYGLAEEELLKITGSSPENPTMSLPCREVFARGQRQVTGDSPRRSHIPRVDHGLIVLGP